MLTSELNYRVEDTKTKYSPKDYGFIYYTLMETCSSTKNHFNVEFRRFYINIFCNLHEAYLTSYKNEK